MTERDLMGLRQSLRGLRGSITSLQQVIPVAAHQDRLHLAATALERSYAELVALLGLEQAAVDAPHAFVQPFAGPWCARCRGTRDRTALHPPELQVNHEGAARAAGGS